MRNTRCPCICCHRSWRTIITRLWLRFIESRWLAWWAISDVIASCRWSAVIRRGYSIWITIFYWCSSGIDSCWGRRKATASWMSRNFNFTLIIVCTTSSCAAACLVRITTGWLVIITTLRWRIRRSFITFCVVIQTLLYVWWTISSIAIVASTGKKSLKVEKGMEIFNNLPIHVKSWRWRWLKSLWLESTSIACCSLKISVVFIAVSWKRSLYSPFLLFNPILNYDKVKFN